jgi:predicted DNA-binding transcriptional regulator YafY
MTAFKKIIYAQHADQPSSCRSLIGKYASLAPFAPEPRSGPGRASRAQYLLEWRRAACAIPRETAARECAMRGEADRAALLREASTILKAVMRPDALRRAEPDISALMEAEGVAMRPGPRPVITPGVLPSLRRAILGMQPVVVRYANPEAKEPATRILCPYGILYGGRGWVVAHVDNLPELRLWRLDRIVSIDLLDRVFARREDFDLSAYAAQSFGVFQEEPIDVVLRFEPDAADDVAGWLFHPSQTIEREEDGALTVRFRAGGAQEMCWHLFTWGASVTILEPDSLRIEMEDLARKAAEHHAQPRQSDGRSRDEIRSNENEEDAAARIGGAPLHPSPEQSK